MNYQDFMDIPTTISLTDGRFIPKRSIVIKNKRRKAHLLRVKRNHSKRRK